MSEKLQFVNAIGFRIYKCAGQEACREVETNPDLKTCNFCDISRHFAAFSGFQEAPTTRGTSINVTT